MSVCQNCYETLPIIVKCSKYVKMIDIYIILLYGTYKMRNILEIVLKKFKFSNIRCLFHCYECEKMLSILQ